MCGLLCGLLCGLVCELSCGLVCGLGCRLRCGLGCLEDVVVSERWLGGCLAEETLECLRILATLGGLG